MLRHAAKFALGSGSAAREALCSTSSALSSQSRLFSEAAAGSGSEQIGNEKVRKLADEITGLTVLECSWLSEILRKKLNMAKPAFGSMPMMPMMGAMPAAPAAGAARVVSYALPADGQPLCSSTIHL